MSQRRMAALVCAGTSFLFVLVYGVSNGLAAARGSAGSFHFGWETAIPLVPAMIIPYMSIDLFFVAAPFVCGSKREIGMFARRVATAIVIAGVFFAAWPLTPGFERVTVEGAFGPLFNSLYAFDQPYNLFPSLHVTLAFILRWTYHRHTKGATRWLMHGWFVLVTASTLFTHQHHIVDIVGGAALALFVFYLYPTGLIAREDVRVERAPSPRLALVFGAGAVGALLLTWFAAGVHWAWAVVPAWAALSLVIVALGYGWLGPRVFRKYAGYLSIPARFVLWPYLGGLWLTRQWFWARARVDRVDVGGGVSYGRLPRRGAVSDATIIDLTAEHNGARGSGYVNFPVLDLTKPDRRTLDAVADRIERGRALGRVYVHCALGLGRSAYAVAYWQNRSDV